MSIDLFCAIMRPSFTNERIETGILRFLRRFLSIYKKGKGIRPIRQEKEQTLGLLQCLL